MIAEKKIHPLNGYIMLIAILVITAIFAYLAYAMITRDNPLFVPVIILGSLTFALGLSGLFVVNPNESSVLTLFGKYAGTVKEDGLHWANPFYKKSRISLRARNFTTEHLKVNDKIGNPIMIGAVVVWQVEETAKASFEVDNYLEYVNIQSETALRNLASKYSYDHFDDHGKEITLRSEGDVVNKELETELSARLELAGIQVIEGRIVHLAYASEIAQAMLQRQQATAIVAARSKIVEGAVGMVKMALDQLKQDSIVDLDEEKKAAMVSNLMVVLCSDKSTQPVINAGSLY